MDKATGRPLMVGGSEVTSEKEFASIAPFGYVKVEFTFDASALAGKEIVVFEGLEHEGIEIAAHADIYDEGQTVKVEPVPEIGAIATDAADIDDEGQSVDLAKKPKPEVPRTSLAQTSDTNRIVPLVCLAVVAALAATLAALQFLYDLKVAENACYIYFQCGIVGHVFDSRCGKYGMLARADVSVRLSFGTRWGTWYRQPPDSVSNCYVTPSQPPCDVLAIAV